MLSSVVSGGRGGDGVVGGWGGPDRAPKAAVAV